MAVAVVEKSAKKKMILIFAVSSALNGATGLIIVLAGLMIRRMLMQLQVIKSQATAGSKQQC